MLIRDFPDLAALSARPELRAEILRIIDESPHKAAKWIRDTETGAVYVVPAMGQTHAQMAEGVHFENYDKGLLVAEDVEPRQEPGPLSGS